MKWKLALDVLVVKIFALFGVWLAFGQDKFDFAGATSCSCETNRVKVGDTKRPVGRAPPSR